MDSLIDEMVNRLMASASPDLGATADVSDKVGRGPRPHEPHDRRTQRDTMAMTVGRAGSLARIDVTATRRSIALTIDLGDTRLRSSR